MLQYPLFRHKSLEYYLALQKHNDLQNLHRNRQAHNHNPPKGTQPEHSQLEKKYTKRRRQQMPS